MRVGIVASFLLNFLAVLLVCLSFLCVQNVRAQADNPDVYFHLNPAPWQAPDGFEIYGKYAAEEILLKIHSPVPLGEGTTLWLDTDRDEQSGYLVFGWAVGAEYRVEFSAGVLSLAEFNGSEFVLIQNLDVSVSEEGNSVEVSLPLAALDFAKSVAFYLDVNNEIFLPSSYANAPYVLRDWPRETGAADGRGVAIVHSASSAANFVSEKNDAQLFMALQHQAMMAGLPFDVFSEEDLADPQNFLGYSVLILPNFSSVNRQLESDIVDTLFYLIYYQGVGILSSGNFLSLDESGQLLHADAYRNMKQLLGLHLQGGLGPSDIRVTVAASTHPMLKDYHSGEELMKLSGTWFSSYRAMERNPVDVLVNFETAQGLYPAALAADDYARFIHFATPQLLGNSNLGWSALQSLVFADDELRLGLKLSRFESLFLSRHDMDESQYAASFSDLYTALASILDKWNKAYDFVGSYYINIGNDRAAGKYTNWKKAARFYKNLLKDGNEIGTHSYTHPFDVDLLSESELYFEFVTSRDEIGNNLGIKVTGAAIPGDPESLAVDRFLDPYFEHLSGEYSGYDSGYAGAFGLLLPDSTSLYFGPDLLPDFTMIEFWGWTAAQAKEKWLSDHQRLLRHAAMPLVVWTWHDYGPTGFAGGNYNLAMYENLVAQAFAAGAEFTTLGDATRRIRGFLASDLRVQRDGNGIVAELAGTGLGQMALKLYGGERIAAVEDWYAYSNDRVFVPEEGGIFVIRTGSLAEAVTRIIDLPMRARLISVWGDGKQIKFVFAGAGKVRVKLSPLFKNKIPKVIGAKNFFRSTEGVLTLKFSGNDVHEVIIE